MDFILNNLAIGNYEEALRPAGAIDALLCVAQERDVHDPRCLYHKVPIVDMQPIPAERLEEAVRWLTGTIESHTIMVFCNAGIGRSSSVVIAYLCCRLGYSFGQAVEYVAARRPYMSILPNLITSIEEVKRLLVLGSKEVSLKKLKRPLDVSVRDTLVRYRR
jgi:protein-tyrosine phosphatase